jgi:hypothetical protein
VLQPNPNGGAPLLTQLAGSAQRIMIPYFDPRVAGTDTVFRAVLAGNFVPTSGNTQYADIVGIASTQLNASTQQVRAWLVPGTPDGLDGTQSNGLAMTGLTDCALHGGTGFCYEEGTYVAWPTAAGPDRVIGVDKEQPPSVAFVDAPPGATMLSAMPLPEFAAAIPAGNTVRAMYAYDANGDDGDGALDLVASFAPAAGGINPGTGALLVCEMDTTGTPQQCTDLTPAVRAANPMTTGCYDVAPGRFAFRDPTSPAGGSPGLVALCRDDGATLYRISFTGGTYHADVLGHSTAPLSALRVGDINGDGLDDVVAVAGDRGSQTLVVFPQCSSRSLATCQLGAGGQP